MLISGQPGDALAGKKAELEKSMLEVSYQWLPDYDLTRLIL